MVRGCLSVDTNCTDARINDEFQAQKMCRRRKFGIALSRVAGIRLPNGRGYAGYRFDIIIRIGQRFEGRNWWHSLRMPYVAASLLTSNSTGIDNKPDG